MLSQRFYDQLPEFARPSNPIMRYLLLRTERKASRRGRLLRVLVSYIGFAMLVLLAYTQFSVSGTQPIVASSQNPLDSLFLVMFFPLVFWQFVARATALISTATAIGSEERLGTWDTLKITADGAKLTLKVRWAAFFYGLGSNLFLQVAMRLLFVYVMFTNLASHNGFFINNMITGTTPFGLSTVSATNQVTTGIIIVAMQTTAALVLPFTAVAFDAALGLWIGAMFRGRFAVGIAVVIAVVLRAIIILWGLWVASTLLSLSPFPELVSSLSPGEMQLRMKLLGIFAGIAEGDLGLAMLHIPHVQNIWADYNYGIFVGVALLGYAVVQAAATNVLVHLACRRALRANRN
jgi:hypothetical protein